MLKDFGGPQIHTQPHIFQQTARFMKGIAGIGDMKSPIWSKAPQEGHCDPSYASFFHDDFFEYITAHRWTTFGDTGVVTVTADNVITIAPTAVTDTHAGGIATTNKLWLPSATQKIFFEARVKFTEAATNEAAVFVGMTGGTVASDVPLIDDVGTPTTDDRIAIWKQNTGTVWQCGISVGATQDDGTTGITRVSGAWTLCGFVADATGVDFYINNKFVRRASTVAAMPDTAMAICICVKQGSGVKETVSVDWVKCVSLKTA